MLNSRPVLLPLPSVHVKLKTQQSNVKLGNFGYPHAGRSHSRPTASPQRRKAEGQVPGGGGRPERQGVSQRPPKLPQTIGSYSLPQRFHQAPKLPQAFLASSCLRLPEKP